MGMDNDDVIECTIEERGNGFPEVGDYCACSGNGQLYRIVSTGRINIDSEAGRPNWCDGTVELAEWSDCSEEDEHTAAVVLDAR